MWGSNCWWWGPGYFFGGPWGMWVGMLFWILILVGFFYLVSWLVKHPSISPSSGTALEILKRRYASGEMDSEEYLKRKRGLQS